MRLVATEYVSIDGVCDEPGQWAMPYFSEQAGRFKSAELDATDALLLGRRTYEGFAAAWPTMEAGEFGVRMNTITKYVVSSTLRDPAWSGSVVLDGDLAESIGRLKSEPGGDLLLSGSPMLFAGLHDLGLIDLYRLMIHPIVLGAGTRLLAGDTRTGLELVHHEVFDTGIIIAEYRPALP